MTNTRDRQPTTPSQSTSTSTPFGISRIRERAGSVLSLGTRRRKGSVDDAAGGGTPKSSRVRAQRERDVNEEEEEDRQEGFASGFGSGQGIEPPMEPRV
jgi:phospholipid-translocating ATPase